MKVAIYSRGVDIDQQQSLQALLHALDKYAVTIYVYEELLDKFNLQASVGKEPLIAFNSFSAIHDSIDCLISLGGDGTVLDAVTLVGDTNIPILGINYGRLGFLASISKDELSLMVDALINRTFVIEKRALMHLDSNLPIFGTTPFGLNEFVIHKRDTSPMIKIHTYLNGEFLNSYWADGLIVSTATGSTGYSLSVGGPLVMPSSDILIIAPMSPHNLNVRPLVVSSSSKLRFEVSSRSQNFLVSIDSRSKAVDSKMAITVEKAEFVAKIVKIPGDDFLQTLRNKLNWGLDVRN